MTYGASFETRPKRKRNTPLVLRKGLFGEGAAIYAGHARLVLVASGDAAIVSPNSYDPDTEASINYSTVGGERTTLKGAASRLCGSGRLVVAHLDKRLKPAYRSPLDTQARPIQFYAIEGIPEYRQRYLVDFLHRSWQLDSSL